VGDEDPLGAGHADCFVETDPVGVVGHYEATVGGKPAADAPERHPAAGKRGGRSAEAARPGRAKCGGRRDDEGAGMRLCGNIGVTGRVAGRWKPWARRTSLVFSMAPWVRIGPIAGSVRMRCGRDVRITELFQLFRSAPPA
jgi:hypothetical protein